MNKLDMSAMVNAVCSTLKEGAVDRQPGDYIDPADGLLHCGTCHTPKEHLIQTPQLLREVKGPMLRLPRACKCQADKLAHDEVVLVDRKHIQRVAELRASGIRDARLRECTFETDDQQDLKTREICKRYVERWEKVKSERIGLLLWGETGCGKTFFAACIANALIEQEIKVMLTSIPDLSARFTANYGEGREVVLEEVRRVPLLILDDVGFERTTPTSIENAFSIVDARYDSGKPLIVTTNLTPDEIRNPTEVAHKRTLSRIAELCAVPVQVSGSRREGIAQNRRARALEVLLSDD